MYQRKPAPTPTPATIARTIHIMFEVKFRIFLCKHRHTSFTPYVSLNFKDLLNKLLEKILFNVV